MDRQPQQLTTALQAAAGVFAIVFRHVLFWENTYFVMFSQYLVKPILAQLLKDLICSIKSACFFCYSTRRGGEIFRLRSSAGSAAASRLGSANSRWLASSLGSTQYRMYVRSAVCM